MTHRSL